MRAQVTMRQILATNQRGEQQLLIEIDIDCDGCGHTQGVIYGHHLRTLQKALEIAIAKYPALCGEVGEITDNLDFGGAVNPEKARYN